MGRGRREGTGASLEGWPPPPGAEASRLAAVGALATAGRAELASFPLLQWLPCLRATLQRPASAGCCISLGAGGAAPRCVAVS